MSSGGPPAVPGGGKRVGVFGGTFNPVHLGHLRAAEEVCERLELERMLFVPAADPPLKRDEAGDPLAPARLRLAWVREAVADNPRFEASPVELDREGPSYTIDTLLRLREERAPERLVFVVGCDAFRELGSWREPVRLLGLCDFAVTTRPPARGGLADWIPDGLRDLLVLEPDGESARHREAGTRVCRVAIDALDVSATDVRRRIRHQRSVRYLLPETVRRAVIESGAYARNP